MGDLTPADIARRVGVSGVRVRRLLREMYPRLAPGSGVPWDLSNQQIDEVLAYFRGVRSGYLATQAATGATMGQDAVPPDWFWEGHVQDRVVDHLRREGWSIARVANTATRSTGPDIDARSGTQRLMVRRRRPLRVALLGPRTCSGSSRSCGRTIAPAGRTERAHPGSE